jgi:hypothetical protein
MKSDRTRATLGASISFPPDVRDALRHAQEALQGDSNDEYHEALYTLVNVLEEASVDGIGDDPLPAVDAQVKPMKHESATDIKLVVPTYYGKWIQETPGLEDFDEPHQPVLITQPDGLRLSLGTHDNSEFHKPEIQIERRRNGWMIFLQPLGAGETSGFVVFLDDGRSFVAPDGPRDYQVSMVVYEQAVAELDEIKPTCSSCAPTAIIECERKVR